MLGPCWGHVWPTFTSQPAIALKFSRLSQHGRRPTSLRGCPILWTMSGPLLLSIFLNNLVSLLVFFHILTEVLQWRSCRPLVLFWLIIMCSACQVKWHTLAFYIKEQKMPQKSPQQPYLLECGGIRGYNARKSINLTYLFWGSWNLSKYFLSSFKYKDYPLLELLKGSKGCRSTEWRWFNLVTP